VSVRGAETLTKIEKSRPKGKLLGSNELLGAKRRRQAMSERKGRKGEQGRDYAGPAKSSDINRPRMTYCCLDGGRE